MLPLASAEAPRRPLLAHPALLTLGLLSLIFGLMGSLMGGILLGLCLVGGGILCSGTMIGSMGSGALFLGVPLLLVGLAVLLPGRRASNEYLKVRLERAGPSRRSDVFSTLQLEVAPARGGAAGNGAPISSKCPECGGPVEPEAERCVWCGQPFR